MCACVCWVCLVTHHVLGSDVRCVQWLKGVLRSTVHGEPRTYGF